MFVLAFSFESQGKFRGQRSENESSVSPVVVSALHGTISAKSKYDIGFIEQVMEITVENSVFSWTHVFTYSKLWVSHLTRKDTAERKEVIKLTGKAEWKNQSFFNH